LYYIYIALLCVFSTNAINILAGKFDFYAGVNGVEAIQSVVITCSLILNALLQMVLNPSRSDSMVNVLYFLFPYLGASLAYTQANWYPAAVFGGDTFCYFSGMVFAVIGVLGNLSKTVLLFMIPQIFNFLYSCPQLFHFVDCPRHRMPVYSQKTGLIEYTTFKVKPTKTKKDVLGLLMIRILEFLNLAQVTRNKSGAIVECNNLTLINLILVKFGPMKEETLASHVFAFQVLGSLIAFTIRYGLVHIVYN
jgi:UDP-N-acetylglucosamine--dolichyl-phosphate N-acetylglucosaminephosphotransferase